MSDGSSSHRRRCRNEGGEVDDRGRMVVGGCALMMVVMMVMMIPMMGRGHGHPGHSGHGWSDDPERTLADRLARGEIDTEEYERRLEALRRTDHPAHT